MTIIIEARLDIFLPFISRERERERERESGEREREREGERERGRVGDAGKEEGRKRARRKTEPGKGRK